MAVHGQGPCKRAESTRKPRDTISWAWNFWDWPFEAHEAHACSWGSHLHLACVLTAVAACNSCVTRHYPLPLGQNAPRLTTALALSSKCVCILLAHSLIVFKPFLNVYSCKHLRTPTQPNKSTNSLEWTRSKAQACQSQAACRRIGWTILPQCMEKTSVLQVLCDSHLFWTQTIPAHVPHPVGPEFRALNFSNAFAPRSSSCSTECLQVWTQRLGNDKKNLYDDCLGSGLDRLLIETCEDGWLKERFGNTSALNGPPPEINVQKKRMWQSQRNAKNIKKPISNQCDAPTHPWVWMILGYFGCAAFSSSSSSPSSIALRRASIAASRDGKIQQRFKATFPTCIVMGSLCGCQFWGSSPAVFLRRTLPPPLPWRKCDIKSFYKTYCGIKKGVALGV